MNDAAIREKNLHTVNYATPFKFSQGDAERLMEKVGGRFRFNAPKFKIDKKTISISFDFGTESPKERISEYVAGFLDAIG